MGALYLRRGKESNKGLENFSLAQVGIVETGAIDYYHPFIADCKYITNFYLLSATNQSMTNSHGASACSISKLVTVMLDGRLYGMTIASYRTEVFPEPLGPNNLCIAVI